MTKRITTKGKNRCIKDYESISMELLSILDASGSIKKLKISEI